MTAKSKKNSDNTEQVSKQDDNGKEKEATVADIGGETYLVSMLEALLFATEEPLSEDLIAETLPDVLEAQVPQLVESLQARYEERGSGLTVQRAAGGWRLATHPDFADIVRQHLRGKLRTRLSRAALETVSIIAYRQPISRGEIEQMRGVDSGAVLRTLLERELVRITGRADAPGRPLLYGTTKSFLEYFGLEDLKSLPHPEELIGDLSEEQSGVPVMIRRGPFEGADSGVEDEVYRVDHETAELEEEEGQGPLPGIARESSDEPSPFNGNNDHNESPDEDDSPAGE